MNSTIQKSPSRLAPALFYLAFTYGLAITLLGSLVLLAIEFNPGIPRPGCAALIYLSGGLTGLLTLPGVGRFFSPAIVWLPVAGIVLSAILGAMACGLWVISHLLIVP